MPSRGSYQVASQEEGKAAQRDESYKSCVTAMLVFFLLCIVIILASWPWNKWHTNHNYVEEDSKETARIAGEGFSTTTDDSEIFRRTRDPVKNDHFERYSNDVSTKNHKMLAGTTERYEKTREMKTDLPPTATQAFSTPATKSEMDSGFPNVVRTDRVTRREDLSSSTESVLVNRPQTVSSPETTSKVYKGVSGVVKSDRSTVKGNLSSSTESVFVNRLQTVSTPETTSKVYKGLSGVVKSDGSTVKENLSSSTESVFLNRLQTVSTPETTGSVLVNRLQTVSTPETTSKMYKGVSSVVISDRSTVKENLSSSTEAMNPSREQPNTETTHGYSMPESDSTSVAPEIGDSTRKIETTRRPNGDFTSLQRLLVGAYFGNETTISSDDDSEGNWLDDMQAKTTREAEGLPGSTSASPQVGTSPSKWSYTTASANFERTPTGSSGTEAKAEVTTESSVTKEQISRKREIKICESGSCKHVASKMLSYMNHSVQACDDFYEYACGGLEADPEINEKDFHRRAYDTIALQAHMRREQPEYAQFGRYYESCLNYESSFEKSHRIKLAKEALNEVGKFYTNATWPGEFQNFTTLFANMLLHNGPLLFDIVPDINETNPEAFTLTIGPAVDRSPFQLANVHDPCDEVSEAARHHEVDLGELYENYKNCKYNTSHLIHSITDALKELAIFEDLEIPYKFQYFDGTILNIDLEIIKGFLAFFPPEHEILGAYRTKNYEVMTLEELEDDCKLINWSELIFYLTGLTLGPSTQVQVYYKRELMNAMRGLDRFRKNSEFELNNALLGLYARNLYQDLVAPRSSSDLEKHCLHTASHFLKREASKLYMSSFTADNLKDIETKTQRLFHDLKDTLKVEIRRSNLAVEWEQQVLKKLDDMKMVLPDPSYLKNTDSNKLNMTDNYFENSLTLMKKYRSMIYSVIQKNPNDPEQIWTFFASPFQSTTQRVYELNLIVVPFGAIDWPLLVQKESFDYLVQATVGNSIAREIAQNFLTKGINYECGSDDSEFTLITDNDMTKSIFTKYINCQEHTFCTFERYMFLPATGQRVSYTISPLTLNEMLSDAVGMRLAHDTLARLEEERLTWLDLDVSQLFYLAYAQTHCTKAPLTSSYVSLYEGRTLPSRIRIFIAASNDRLLGEAWNCYTGSETFPGSGCDVYPFGADVQPENHAYTPDAA